MGGVHSVPNRSEPGRLPARGGRPESETDTPVNIENGLYRDNGEGVAATPLPYPLRYKSCKVARLQWLDFEELNIKIKIFGFTRLYQA